MAAGGSHGSARRRVGRGLVAASGYLFGELAADFGLEPPTPLTYGAGLVMCLALALRRVYPIAVFVVVSIAFSVYGFTGGYDMLVASVALFIATVAAGSHGAPRVRDWARGVVIAGLFGTIFYFFYFFYVSDAQDTTLVAVWFGQAYVLALNVFYFAAAWVLGDQLRVRRQRETQLAERTTELSARQIELEAERERSRGPPGRSSAGARRSGTTTRRCAPPRRPSQHPKLGPVRARPQHVTAWLAAAPSLVATVVFAVPATVGRWDGSHGNRSSSGPQRSRPALSLSGRTGRLGREPP